MKFKLFYISFFPLNDMKIREWLGKVGREMIMFFKSIHSYQIQYWTLYYGGGDA